MYARALLDNLASEEVSSRDELERVIDGLTGNVDSIYMTALRRCVGTNPGVVRRFQAVMTVILFGKLPMTEEQIAKLLRFSVAAVGSLVLQVRRNLCSLSYSICVFPFFRCDFKIRSILKLENDGGVVEILHKSVKDFLTSRDRCSDSLYYIDEATAEAFLASECIVLLNGDQLQIICLICHRLAFDLTLPAL